MRTLTRLTAASVATLTLTAGTFAAFAAVHDSHDRQAASGGAPYRHEASGTEKKASGATTSKHASATTTGSTSTRTANATRAAAWSPRGVQYPKTVTLHDLKIPMDDGVVLRADLLLPADADGKAIDKKFPVIATITAYNKGVQQYAGGLAGGDPKYLVQRGYAQLTVDARGTGTSAGQWCTFCSREDKDFTEVMQWAHEQSWGNGLTAMDGPSYMGIAQMFAAAGHPDGLKAIFPQVPAADVYRDVVASGGQLDVGFIPLWLGLVTVTGLIPPTAPPKDASPLMALAQHLIGAGTFTAPLVLKAFAGQEPAYDGPFFTQRSPINVVGKVDVPTFFVSGEFDLFQRGTPLLFENLQKRGIPTKLIIGPWNHLQASGGTEVTKAGLGTLDELKLRWFDRYVKGLADPDLDTDIPPMTYFEQGTGAWKSGAGWMKNRSAATYKLSGTSKTAGASGALTTGAVATGISSVYPIPVSGLCTRSTDQWTAGLMSEFPFPNPCNTNNAWNDKTGVVFRTAPVTKAVALQGPINARLYVSSSSGDGMLSVAVEDEAPDGTVSRLTGGWQVISHRALNTARSRYLDGQLIQPYHPFTKAAQAKLAKGAVAPVDVEVFPTGAKILPGHRLRIAVQAFDIPHLAPILPDILSTLTVIKIFSSATYPSRITLPLVD
jgi:putative CocE/NonD family hydrolase